MDSCLLREVVVRVLLEKAATDGEITLSSDDIFFSLTHKSESSVLHGVEVYTPYLVKKEMPSKPRGGALAQLNPFDVVSTVKYGAVDAKDGKRLIAAPNAAAEMVDVMADRIARRFEDENVAAVTCVDSSHGMAAALAKSVADKLGKAYQPVVKKTADVNVSWDPDEWDAYASQVRQTGLNGRGDPLMIKGKVVTPDEYLAATMVVMGNELGQAKRQIKRGEKPSLVRSTNMKTGHKRFFNFFDKIADNELAPGSKVLVVDDNIDSGWTPYHVAKRMRAAGLEPLFAAGFKMMRYYDKKPAVAKSRTPELDKAITDLGALADEFAGHLFQVGNHLIAKFNSERRGVGTGDVYKVMKVRDGQVELSDVDTGNVVKLRSALVAPKQADLMWLAA